MQNLKSMVEQILKNAENDEQLLDALIQLMRCIHEPEKPPSHPETLNSLKT